jgi:hypothetical protein
VLGSTGRLSLAIPVAFSRSNDHRDGTVPEDRGARDFEVLYIAPGLKYHPFGTRKVLDFAIGAELATGRLFVRQLPARINIGNEPLHEYTSIFLAPRLNLSLNARFGAHLLAGVFASAGPFVVGNTGRMANGSAANSALIQAGLRIGAHF